MQPKPRGGGAVAKLGKEQLPIVEALVKAQPDALLIKMCERFAQQTGIEVSVSTMQRAVCQLKLSVKLPNITWQEFEVQMFSLKVQSYLGVAIFAQKSIKDSAIGQ